MKKRYYKDIDTQTFDFIYGDSPVELIDRTSCYDIETFKYYLKVRLRNVSGRDIASVKIRVDLYDGISILPYKKLDYVYKVRKKKKENTDIIGDSDYIPIPESYYKSLDINIISVTFAKGETVELGLSSMKKAKLISDQPNHIITACESLFRFNVYLYLHNFAPGSVCIGVERKILDTESSFAGYGDILLQCFNLFRCKIFRFQIIEFNTIEYKIFAQVN